MRRLKTKRSILLTAAAICAVGSGLSVSPPRLTEPLRGAVLDVVVSGQAFALSHYEAGRRSLLLVPARWLARDDKSPAESLPSASEGSPLDESRRKLEQTCRQLRIENAQLREELQLAEKYGVSPIPVSTAPRASAATLVRAGLVNGHMLEEWRSVPLDQGRTAGVTESSLVLEDGLPHLDQGSDAGIEPELDVLIGRCVVGRIASVGRFTSTLESITDSHYRALAQIVRPSDQGGSFGTEGILVGQGNGRCKLTEVPNTETVRVGDEVYTSQRDARAGAPLYYGRISKVEEAGRHWDITVEPAAKAGELRSVVVLKLPPSFTRPLAQ